MSDSIHYLMSGPAHLPYLVVSLHTLRRHYGGPVVVHAYPESFDLVREIATDPSLNIQPTIWEPVYRGKNGQFINKISLMRTLDSEGSVVYLDADTMINGPVGFLHTLNHEFEFVATQFCDWITNVGTIRKRVANLLGREWVDQDAVHALLNNRMPSVNGGVFACRPDSEVLQTWHAWTVACRDLFIADETVLHAVMAHYAATGDKSKFHVCTGGLWNASPKYGRKTGVVVWHGHGDSFVRPNKSQYGVDLWLPVFNELLHSNTGRMADWIKKIDNKFLDQLLKEKR